MPDDTSREQIIKRVARSIPGWPPPEQLSEEQMVNAESMANALEQVSKQCGVPLESFFSGKGFMW
jgi:hypothetical protein